MNREMLCISCPLGCRLKVLGSMEDLRITGHRCLRGEIYAREEVANPKRVVTATAAIKGGLNMVRMPVKTDAPLPKQNIAALLNDLYQMELAPPINRGDVIIDNYKGTGVSVIATRSCEGHPESLR